MTRTMTSHSDHYINLTKMFEFFFELYGYILLEEKQQSA